MCVIRKLLQRRVIMKGIKSAEEMQLLSLLQEKK